MPANEKGLAITEIICSKIAQNKKESIKTEKIEICDLHTAEDRIAFFIKLISGIPDYSLETVTNLKVASWQDDDIEEDDIDLESDREAKKQEIISVVTSVILKGSNLAASPQYQRLLEEGFFITSLTWRSKGQHAPHEMVQFNVAFDNGVHGTGFKYEVKAASHRNGQYNKYFKPVDGEKKIKLFELIEATARKVLIDIRALLDGRREISGQGDNA